MVHGVETLSMNSQLFHNNGCEECVGEVTGLTLSSVQDDRNMKESKSLWSSIFSSPKKMSKQSETKADPMARFVEQLAAEGRSAENIALHLSHLRDLEPLDPEVSTQKVEKTKSKVNPIVKLFKALHNALTEEIQAQHMYPMESESRFLTVSISTAPFYAAPPPDTDLSFDEFATLEPVYNCNQSINLLPVSKFDGTPLPGHQTSCAICLGEFAEQEELKSLHCVHFYHKECIDRWLMVGHNCPVCKALVV